MDEGSGPPEAAYGRVTAPERYAVLAPAARTLIEELTRRYEVTVTELEQYDAELPAPAETEHVMRLEPASDTAAPLTIAFTSFPGLVVRFGAWHVEAFPTCGCDACDEQPEQLVGELCQRIDAVVQGRFSEELRGGWKPWRSAELAGDGWRRGTASRIDRAELRRLGGRARRDWAPWPERQPSSTSLLA